MTIAGEPLLQVDALSVVVEDASPLFPEVSFRLSAGDFLVILGPNGAGKTLLLQSLIGYRAHSGKVSWARGSRIGYLPQRFEPGRDLPLTVQDFFRLKKRISRSPKVTLKSVGLEFENFCSRRLSHLSRGELQRVLLAWVLAGDPQILILDEPSAGIDLLGGEALRRLLHAEKVERRTVIILVTHDLSLVSSLADRVLLLNPGESRMGEPADILNRVKSGGTFYLGEGGSS